MSDHFLTSGGPKARDATEDKRSRYVVCTPAIPAGRHPPTTMKTKRIQILAVTTAVILPCATLQVAAQTGAVQPPPQGGTAPVNPGTAAAAEQMGYAVANGTVYAIQGGRAVPVTTVQSMRDTPRGIGGIDSRVLNLQAGQMLTSDGRVVVVPKNVTGIPAAGSQTAPGRAVIPSGVTPAAGSSTTITPHGGNPATPQSGTNAPSNSPSTGTPTRR